MSAADRTCPHVYRAINRIMAEFAKAGIAKSHINLIDQYQYRSIDDVLNRLSPLLSRYKLCVLPRVLERHCQDCDGGLGALLVSVRLLVAFDLVSARDGSMHTVQAWGEALDPGDKGTAKAMSSAFKCAMLEVFCVPVSSEDTDALSPKLAKPEPVFEPPQGWQAWAEDIREMINACESREALDRVRTRHAKLLGAMRREQRETYDAVGERFQQRLAELADPKGKGRQGTAAPKGKPGAKRVAVRPLRETVDA